MNLNHLNLRVADPVACRDFYHRHFDFEPAFEAEGGFFLRNAHRFELLRHTRAATWQGIDRIAMEFHEYDPSQQHGELVSTLRAQGFTVRTRRSWYQEKVQKVGNLWAWRS